MTRANHFFKFLHSARLGPHRHGRATKTVFLPPMFEGVATAYTCAYSTSIACNSLGRHCTRTRSSQSSSHGSVHPHLAGNVHVSVRASCIEKKDIVPPLVPLLPCWSIVIATSEAGVSTKTGIRDGSVLMDQRWLQFNGSTSSWLHSRQDIRRRKPGTSSTLQQ